VGDTADEGVGITDVHVEKRGPFGDGWQIRKYYGALETPAYASLIGFPLAWTPGTERTGNDRAGRLMGGTQWDRALTGAVASISVNVIVAKGFEEDRG
jgi:hypothetical protein